MTKTGVLVVMTTTSHDSVPHSYQWFCHFDDDVYVNVPQLSKLLQQYDPHQPYYLGKWPGKKRNETNVVVSYHIVT